MITDWHMKDAAEKYGPFVVPHPLISNFNLYPHIFPLLSEGDLLFSALKFEMKIHRGGP